MNKFDLYRDEKSIYRILSIQKKILVIDCKKRSMPYFVDEIMGVQISEQDLQVETGRILTNIEDLSPNLRKKAYEKYTVISSVIAVVDNLPLRNSMIEIASQQYNLSKQTIRAYLCLYLSYQDISVFAPAPKQEKELTAAEKNMRWALNKFFYTRNKNSLKTAYEMMLKTRYCDGLGKLLLEHPTFNQFRYFYRKTRKEEKYLISRNGIKDYKKNYRPLLGDGVQSYAPSIGTAMLDSTICDIYLVNEAGELVGRPVLTVACDANTSLCLGYTLGWEGTTYALVKLMLSIIEDKTVLCRSKGIEIKEEQWNVVGFLPSVMITDGGSEYTSSTFAQITDLGVTLIKQPPYRADLKGTVEKCFDIVQDLFKDVLKGKGVIMPDFRQRGSHDYRLDACLTLKEFEQIIVRCLVYYNSERVLENYPYTEEMLDIKPFASDIWNWRIKTESRNLIGVSKETVILTLLPRTTGRFTRYGLKVNKLRYHRDGFKEQYLTGGEVEVTYNPDNVSTVWIKDDKGSFLAFMLIEKRFENKTLEDANAIFSKQNEIIKTEQEANYQAKIDLVSYIEGVSSGKSPPKTRFKEIRKTRTKEKRRNHTDLGGDLNG